MKWEVVFNQRFNWGKISSALYKSDPSMKAKQFHWKTLQHIVHTEQKHAVCYVNYLKLKKKHLLSSWKTSMGENPNSGQKLINVLIF